MVLLSTDPRWGVVRAMPAWQRPGGDQLYGLDAIAAWLDLPERMIRTMAGANRLPLTIERRSHAASRSALARFILALEAQGRAVETVAPPPGNIAPNGCLGLLAGFPAMAGHLGCTVSGIRHRRTRLALPVLWIGGVPLVRVATVARWKEGFDRVTRSDRRQRTVAHARQAAAAPGALIGATAIAAYLGRTRRSTQQAIYEGRLPVARMPGAVIGDRAALAPFIRHQY